MTIEEKLNSAFMKRLEENGAVIQIRHINGQRGGDGHIKPTYSRSRQQYMGFEELSEDEQKKKPWFINKNSNFDIHDRMDIDLSIPQTLAHWQMAKFSPLIAFSEAEARDSDSALFYIHSAQEATKSSVKKKMRINKAENLIINDKKSNLVVRARLLGYDMSADDEMDILDFLLTMAKTNPEKIESIYEDSKNSLRMLLARGLSSGKIRNENKFLMYGAFNLGSDEDTFVRLMSMPQSNELLEQLRNDVEGNVGIPVKKNEPINTEGKKDENIIVEGTAGVVDNDTKEEKNNLPPLTKSINSMKKAECLLYISDNNIETSKPIGEYSYQELKKIVTGTKL